MKQKIIRYFKNVFGTILVLTIIGIIVVISLNGSLEYGNNPLNVNLEKEGPYVFYDSDSSLTVNYIRGNKTDGFYLEQTDHSTNATVPLSCKFPLDSSSFSFELTSDFEVPASSYSDNQPILAISDIESGYKTFRDFLITHEVIDHQLNWTFDQGHLVLVGDFVDRGFSTTQVLWFIYKLEQEAKEQGGQVHFIIGNHELYNMQGKYQSASYKYYAVASILEKQHHELYNKRSFIGRWMASKNSMERINGHLFAHGGIHPEMAQYDITLEEVNQINRQNYSKSYYPKPEETVEQLIISNRKGICWYRGYFKDDLSQEDVEKGLKMFDATAIIVGHTIQWRVNKLYDGKVIAIDVKHPKDYNKNWPSKDSEGLLITTENYFRLKGNGERIKL